MNIEDRSLPHSPEAEQVVLGTVIHVNAHFATAVAAGVTADSFHISAHQTIWDAIAELHAEDKPAEIKAVAGLLRDRKELDRIGNTAYLSTLLDNSQPSSVDYYIGVVREAQIRRALISEAQTTIAKAISSGGKTVVELIAETQGSVDKVRDAANSADTKVGPVSPGQVTLDGLDRESTRGESDAVPTPWEDINNCLRGGGITPGQLWIIGARPAIGKTNVAVSVAVDSAAIYGVRTLCVTGEMDEDEVSDRVVAAYDFARKAKSCDDYGQPINVNLNLLARKHDLTDAELRSAQVVSAEVAELPLDVIYTPLCRPRDIVALLRQADREGNPYGMVVVDYLGLLKGDEQKYGSTYDEVSDISRSLKVIAGRHKVRMIVCAQLNRGNVGRGGGSRPMMSDLRDSGKIEADANGILLLHREDYYDKDTANPGWGEIILAKYRHGPDGITADVMVKGASARWVDPSESDKSRKEQRAEAAEVMAEMRPRKFGRAS